ncbi:unnamed protein product [Vitrella brassicaformis CCMP3155]|uniref:Uncharacterized protein n=1 Tax=Vitrella brassicaformis (strain CCMP3155) TaxID=1169540 RepID=A0A0G4GCS1_VITBC|nr:unnamed protein product [Vitrella brassicaformis CCMP3155]|eukprot:CEM26944.1 unnamed protein product [Vitrella brassicaformis CCMP3155]
MSTTSAAFGLAFVADVAIGAAMAAGVLAGVLAADRAMAAAAAAADWFGRFVNRTARSNRTLRYEVGTRVWMVTAERDKGKQEWVTARVYRIEPRGQHCTAVYVKEAGGRGEVFKPVIVPHRAKTPSHSQEVYNSFTSVDRARDQPDGQHTGLLDVPQDVEKDILCPMLSGDPTISRLSRQHADIYLRQEIDGLLVAKGLNGIITISPNLTSIGLLQRLVYIIEKSGEWAAMVRIVRVAKHQGRVEGRLPIELGSGDVQGVGSRAVFDGSMHFGGSQVTSQYVFQHEDPTSCNRLRPLATQQPPVWNRHTISSRRGDPGYFERTIVLHGDQPDHSFEAHLHTFSCPHYAWVYLYTTERPVAGEEGAARFPQAVQVVRQVVGADDQGVFGGLLA